VWGQVRPTTGALVKKNLFTDVVFVRVHCAADVRCVYGRMFHLSVFESSSVVDVRGCVSGEANYRIATHTRTASCKVTWNASLIGCTVRLRNAHNVSLCAVCTWTCVVLWVHRIAAGVTRTPK
jgi:hypothetical protein